MRLTVAATLVAVGLCLAPSIVRADIPPPVPPPKDVKFTVELDERAKGPKLIVPAGMTRVQFRPRGPVPERGVKQAPPDNDSESVPYVVIKPPCDTQRPGRWPWGGVG